MASELKTVSWKQPPETIELLAAIAKERGNASQASVIRDLIHKEAKRLKISLPKKDKA